MNRLLQKRQLVSEEAVQHLKCLSINLLAIDFDQTFIDVHTGGVWKGTAEELVPHVRSEFQDLVTTAMDSGIHVAIVTFSRQATLIKHVLEAVVGTERAYRIPIRGNDNSWLYEGSGSREGKMAHVASAVEELEQSGEVEITKSTTLLIDDDKKNIKIALDNGVQAIAFSPRKPHRIFRDILSLPEKTKKLC